MNDFAFAGSPNVASSSQGHAKQDLNEKLADAAPGVVQSLRNVSQPANTNDLYLHAGTLTSLRQ